MNGKCIVKITGAKVFFAGGLAAGALSILAAGSPLHAAQLAARMQEGQIAATVGFRSASAPLTHVGIAPSAKQLADRAIEASYGKAQVPAIARALGLPSAERPGQPMRVGSVFESGAPAAVPQWEILREGAVTHFRVSSSGAKGIRARLVLPAGATLGEIRVMAPGDTVAERVPLSAQFEGAIWTPYTEGDTQLIELFTPQRMTGLAVSIADIVHFERSLEAAGGGGEAAIRRPAGPCSPDVVCTTGDAALDAAIDQRRRSVARINFVSGGGSFLCTGTLINSNSRQDFFMTANHCVSTAAEAASITFRWFYEAATCGAGTGSLSPASTSTSGGAQLVFTNQFVDSTLLRLNVPPPSGTVFAGWNTNPLNPGDPVVSISHPTGDVKKYATGTLRSLRRVPDDGRIRVSGYEQEMWAVYFTRGVIEGGSSGSGLFTLLGGDLQFRGVLSNSTVRNHPNGLSCTNTDENANYGRWDYFQPQVAAILDGFLPPLDDHVNQPAANSTPLVLNGPTVGGKIDYVGDLDTFRITVTEPGNVYIKSTGGYDLIVQLMDSAGTVLENPSGDAATNDDGETTGVDFGLAWSLTPGTYYALVANWIPTDLTPNGYGVQATFTNATKNYTALWWGGEAESGWGMNINHQSNTMFATMFNYENAGQGNLNPGMWLVATLNRVGMGDSYSGRLLRVVGPAFNANPFPNQQISVTDVGPLTVSFSSESNGVLSYAVSGGGTGGAGNTITKNITRQSFGMLPTCTFTGSNRTYADNLTDLWWNPNESGWGVNFTHQGRPSSGFYGGTTIFATLFTYEPGPGNNNKGMWLTATMPHVSDSTFAGDLLQVTGSAFDASPFVPLNAAVNVRQVGRMSVAFDATNRNRGTLTYDVNGAQVVKSIERQVFAAFRTECAAP